MAELDEAELAAVRTAFFERGEDVASWARARGFHPASVYRVLSGQSKLKRGAAHRIAVALGLKKGGAANPVETNPAPREAP
jgi:gp16 family phage-associated protein